MRETACSGLLSMNGVERSDRPIRAPEPAGRCSLLAALPYSSDHFARAGVQYRRGPHEDGRFDLRRAALLTR